MCELAVFVSENGTSRRIARGVVRVDAGIGGISLLDSHGKVTKLDGMFIVALDVTENVMSLRKFEEKRKN
jgi:hypothetical protein